MLDGLTDTGVAVYTGSTLHEVAHVAGAGNAMDPTDALGIAGTATITKMIRVMLLAPVLVVMGFVLAGRRKSAGGRKEKNKIAVPWFAFGFIGVICLNSLLQYLFGVESVREIPLNGVDRIRRYLHADDGHDGAGHRDEPRQVPAGRGEALRAWRGCCMSGWWRAVISSRNTWSECCKQGCPESPLYGSRGSVGASCSE